ncbi:MAG: fumarate reductase/succinate dehydrogenase flavoprotein subunit, partial [Planctomycetaceae bacterium]
HFATRPLPKVSTDHPAFKEALIESRNRLEQIVSIQGRRPADGLHRELGEVMWNQCGMARNAEGLRSTIDRVRELREEFWSSVRVIGGTGSYNQNLEHAGRLADFLEFAELLALDALQRDESCGGHFREESQTEENEARRDDENFQYVAAWEYNGVGEEPTLHKEPLEFEYVKPTQRSYK